MATAASLKGQSYPDVNRAIQDILNMAGSNDLILVCGSVFVVGEIDRESWSQ
jgi:dihydrofolate synthase/folylpolyglutamate synthase